MRNHYKEKLRNFDLDNYVLEEVRSFYETVKEMNDFKDTTVKFTKTPKKGI